MTSLLITGYKAFEIGISTEKDMRINIIKEAGWFFWVIWALSLGFWI